MQKRISYLVRALLCSLAIGALSPSHAEEPSAKSSQSYSLKFVRLYSDENGVSHFKNEELTIRSTAGRPTLSVMQLQGATGATILRLKSGAVEEFHKAPRRQYLFMLRGLVEVTASDGERRKFLPGEVLLVEDVTGKGHVTKSIGAEDHVVLSVPVLE